MAKTRTQAFHESIASEGSAFQHAVVQNVVRLLGELPDREDEDGEMYERIFLVNGQSFQITQTGRERDDYETLILGRVMEQYQQGIIVAGYFVMAPDGLMAGGFDEDILECINSALKQAAEDDPNVSLGEPEPGEVATKINRVATPPIDIDGFLRDVFGTNENKDKGL